MKPTRLKTSALMSVILFLFAIQPATEYSDIWFYIDLWLMALCGIGALAFAILQWEKDKGVFLEELASRDLW